ncbi:MULTISPECIES: peptide deformylase [unclassified Colwellia]|jgi:peptide deformylase|uniref:peptide deformylase n=1 Tax=unclassified Colwellia TaxID=196834 RepID=UPI0015F784C3|nr:MULTISPECIES: peptide deformylase [unclassified Colwellia]MBA6338298.1 peptide deformylase [Colwellia sp. BRX8-7]MBA6357297.1 peptide deformylase [Colwellia sp. BRX8-3]MBA6361095.1 peptide deformylase [Colwellia sp. BRX8-6]MBA6368543.1 peptide deformylase [Colwellia sp. BRX8-5]MBA6375161.1 peptide deformylase [Colwellia sp. BRX8-2]
MTILNVLRFPDERLRTKALPVEDINSDVQQIIDDMFETMREENGVGLAATQVNIHQRIVVINVSEDEDESYVLINPEIISHSDTTEINEEGCLSVPGCYAKVDRYTEVTVKALDREGQAFTLNATELLAVCIQHELDHLDGKLFVDYLSPLKRQRIKAKLEKEARLANN